MSANLKSSSRGAALALGLLVAGSAGAATEVRQHFAYAMPVEVSGSTALARFDVPIEVYRNCLDPQLGDLRVLNGAGEIVPFALQRPPQEIRQTAAPFPLPLFPLRGASAAATAALRLSIHGDQTSIEVQGGQTTDAAAPTKAYLVYAGNLLDPIDSLAFAWPEDAADFSVSVVLQVSDDLVDWRVLVPRASLARLRHGGEVFEQSRVSFGATKARFWRLTAEQGVDLPLFTAATSTPVIGSVPVARVQLEAAGMPAEQPGDYLFDLGAQIPLDRLELALPDINTVAQVEYFARRTSADPWRSVARGSVYRLKTADGELLSPPLVIGAEARRYWRAVVDTRGGGIGQGLPRLRAGWLADQILFVTRGAGPFELVYGSFGAQSANVPLNELMPMGQSGQWLGDASQIPLAQVGAARTAGGPARLLAPPPPKPWRVWLLWAALIAGVATLGMVALNLARQMRAGS